MKKVQTNSMVCHLWANQSQSEARNSNGSIFFEGSELYSYRRSAKIGQIISAPNGENVYFLNSRKYSVTTLRHVSEAKRAISRSANMFSFDFYHSTFGMQGFNQAQIHKIPELLLIEIKNLLVYQCNTITNDWLFRHASGLYNNYKHFCELFAFPNVEFESLENYEKARLKWLRNVEKNGKAAEQRNKEHEEKQAQLKAKQLENLEKWLANDFHTPLHYVPVHLRLSSDRTMIQTTKGASVPVDHAIRLWAAIKAGQDIRRQRIGSFMANSVENDYIRIGCHDIPMSIAAEFMESLVVTV